ncbi:uncharacterized protein LOC132149761 [Carassius carassius]|uniref:uncharacterized protein LOC132149761 n=1 Tax=Carassius carassius TaxID=217509 RepID=UPI0028685498|nr:uncharacterized protein LOC132149761 [Carassius carassius]
MKVLQNQPDENVKTTLEKGGRNPPNETLDNIFNKLLVYIGGSPHLNKTNTNIEKKYDIKREHDDCWPEDDIKRAWGKTQRMDKTSLKRKRWSLAIMLQVIKRRQNFNESKGKEAQSDQSNVENVSLTCVESVDGTPDPMKDTLRHKGSVPKNLLQSGNEKAHETQIKECSNKPNSQNTYIRIPLSVMFKNESTSQGRGKSEGKNRPTYKLIDSIPFLREVRKKKSYVMLYNSQTRNATWVYEILNKSTLAGTQSRKADLKFKDEPFETLYEAANIEECDESNYEQGHLASAANHKWCQEAYEDTFFLSNIAPQVPYLNQNLWKQLENYCQAKINNSENIRNVHVYSGPIYPQSDKRKKAEKLKSWRKKIVPSHFFKVIIIEHENGTVELECYRMPNEEPAKDKQSKDGDEQSKDKNKQSKDKCGKPFELKP